MHRAAAGFFLCPRTPAERRLPGGRYVLWRGNSVPPVAAEDRWKIASRIADETLQLINARGVRWPGPRLLTMDDYCVCLYNRRRRDAIVSTRYCV